MGGDACQPKTGQTSNPEFVFLREGQKKTWCVQNQTIRIEPRPRENRQYLCAPPPVGAPSKAPKAFLERAAEFSLFGKTPRGAQGHCRFSRGRSFNDQSRIFKSLRPAASAFSDLCAWGFKLSGTFSHRNAALIMPPCCTEGSDPAKLPSGWTFLKNDCDSIVLCG